jgi:hypothetical protein
MSEKKAFEHPLTLEEDRKIKAHQRRIGRGVPYEIAHQALYEGTEVIPLAVSGSVSSIDRVQVYLISYPELSWIAGGLLAVAYRHPLGIGGWTWMFLWENTGGDVEGKIIEAGLGDKIDAAARKYGFVWRRGEDSNREQRIRNWLVRKLEPYEDPTHSFTPTILDAVAEGITERFEYLQIIFNTWPRWQEREPEVEGWVIDEVSEHEDPSHGFAPRVIEILALAINNDFDGLRAVYNRG